MTQFHARSRWQRLVNRLATFSLNTALWFGLWLGTFAIMFVLIRGLARSDWLRALDGTPHWIAEIGIRVISLLVLSVWVLLIVRPIRMRWWMVERTARIGRWITSKLRRQPVVETPIFPERLGVLEPSNPPTPMSRRRFLAETAFWGGLLTYSTLVEPYRLDVEEVDLPIANLPPRFEGMKIVQMSDFHINSYTTGEDLARAVEQINRLNPDLVLLTGDFVDWEARYADEATAPFRQIQAREGVYSVIGNHDYYSGDIAHVKQAIQRNGLGLLVNQHTVLRRGADSLTLVGLDDPRHTRGSGVRLSPESINPDKALSGSNPNVPRVLMVHNPVIVPWLAKNHELDVVLCGHTHGGQFQVPILTDTLVRNAEYFVRGRYDLGKTQVYINRGFGFTGPPVRFGVPPEITLINLRNKG